jgi:hypothetical protein
VLQPNTTHLWIPVLVFSLVAVCAICYLLLSAKKHTSIEKAITLLAKPSSVYEIPEGYEFLATAEKRAITIQNLYLNHGNDLDSIAGLLEIDKAFVEAVLITCGHLAGRPAANLK